MKSISGILIALFVIFTSTEVNSTCLELNSQCEDSYECCSGDCEYKDTIDKHVCVNKTDNNVKTYDPYAKVDHGQCSFINKTNYTESLKQEMVKKYSKLYATHALIPVGTKVNITRNDKWVVVTINNLEPLNRSNIELSPSAAMALDIWQDSVVNCDVQILTQSNEFKLSTFIWKPVAVIALYMVAMIVSSYW